MHLLCLSDLHGDSSALAEILQHAPPVDVVLLGGDITNFGTPNQAEQLVDQARRACDRVFAVAGNCDSADIDQRLRDLDVSLFGRGIVHRGVGFFGVSAMPPWTGSMYELSEEEIADALDVGHQQAREAERHVLLSHSPPRNCKLDLTRRGTHVGSLAVRNLIESSRPSVVVCGHIHEARGVETIADSTTVNCGPAYRGNYALVRMDGEIDVELCNVRLPL
jgi:Icc-related predicted phosphoesterase